MGLRGKVPTHEFSRRNFHHEFSAKTKLNPAHRDTLLGPEQHVVLLYENNTPSSKLSVAPIGLLRCYSIPN